MKYKQIQEQVNMIDKALFEELNIAVISNISFEPYFDPIAKQAFSSDHITPIIMPIRYEEYQSAESCLKLERADVIIIILNFEFMFSNLFNDIYSREKDVKTVIADVVSLCENLYYFVLNCSTSQILWFGFEDYYCKEYITKGNVTICQNLIDKLNAHIYEFINKDTTFVDLKRLIANVGISNAYHNKAKYRWHSPYSQQLISEVANEIHKQYLIEKGVTKKCIVLDCDNVLWGGILLEDGIENIKLGGIGTGRVYQDFQSFLLSIYYHGVILAVCSKNDLMDVMTTFREHNEMILKEEHISY